MSNHYHLVLKIDTEQQQKLTQEAVISRWLQLFNGHPIKKTKDSHNIAYQP
ncbi:hypothetical protein [Photobacterium phosphoreum]|uniref:hypothetical protein n=1 Tax=Photobacterium phosphoreum TaxID=659 RepID=UPI0024B8ADA4|nr:hypothetical protein [Photobacterium phosphoreum]